MSVYGVDDLGALSEKVAWGVGGIATVSFGLRVICRVRYSPRQGGGLYLDDFITLAALLVLLLFCILLTASRPFGVGQHYSTLSGSNKIESLRWNVILNCVTPWICTIPKFAIISTLQRILNLGRRTTVLFWSLAISSQATVLGLMIWNIAQCTPVAFQWDRSIEGGSCADPLIYLRYAWTVYVYSTILDVFFALYPVPFIMRLKMPLGARLGVAIPLSLSWIGFAISVYKFSILNRLIDILAVDPSYPLVFLCTTHAAEGAFLIIATSLATLRPLFRGIKQHASELSTNTNRGVRAMRASVLGSRRGPQSAQSQSHEEFMGDMRPTFEEVLMENKGQDLTSDGKVWEPSMSSAHGSERNDWPMGRKAGDSYPV